MRAHHVVISHAAFHAMEAGNFDQLKLGSLVMQDDLAWEESEYAEESLAGNVIEFLQETADE